MHSLKNHTTAVGSSPVRDFFNLYEILKENTQIEGSHVGTCITCLFYKRNSLPIFESCFFIGGFDSRNTLLVRPTNDQFFYSNFEKGDSILKRGFLKINSNLFIPLFM